MTKKIHYGIGYREYKRLNKIGVMTSFLSVIKQIGRDMFPSVKTKRLLNLQVKGV